MSARVRIRTDWSNRSIWLPPDTLGVAIRAGPAPRRQDMMSAHVAQERTVRAPPRIRMRTHVWPVRFAAIAWLITACAVGPRAVPIPPPGALPPRQDLEVWQATQATTLHAVVVTPDSLTGVPVWQSPSCDPCRVAIPLPAIDSIREVSTDKAALGTVAYVAGFAAVALLVWQAAAGD
jgi:hypothetical protein